MSAMTRRLVGEWGIPALQNEITWIKCSWRVHAVPLMNQISISRVRTSAELNKPYPTPARAVSG